MDDAANSSDSIAVNSSDGKKRRRRIGHNAAIDSKEDERFDKHQRRGEQVRVWLTPGYTRA